MRLIGRWGICFILVAVTSTASYGETAKGINWQSDYTVAQKIAVEAKKNVLLLFTGSDWCPACKMLEKQILNDAKFQEFVNQYLIAVLVDFPRFKKIPEKQAQANEALSKKFGVEGFPTLIMLDHNGNLLRELAYNGQTPEAFVTELIQATMAAPQRNPVPQLEGKAASAEVIKLYDGIIFPPKGKSADCWSYLKKKFDYYNRKLVIEPLKSKSINRQTAEWITAMLSNYCSLPGALSIAELEKSGRAIYTRDGQAASPYFLACYLWTVSNQDRQYRRILRMEAMKRLSADKNLPLPLRIIFNKSIGRASFPLVKQALADGELAEAYPQYIYRCLAETDDVKTLESIQAMLEKSKIDPWVAKMIAGKKELHMSWDSRGSGVARTVSEDGWKGFRTHGELAYQYLEEAWNMHPEWPEAAGLLLDASLGQRSNETRIMWFNRAVAAQIDYIPAYHPLLWGFTPRWCGSWHEMLAIGQKAADIDDAWYHTAAPLLFIWAVQDIACEMKFFLRQRRFLREQLPNTRRVLGKKIVADNRHNNPKCASRMYAILAKHLLLCGYYTEAKAALAKAGPGDNGYNVLVPDSTFADTRQEMDIEIALATGTAAKIFQQINAAIDADEIEKAAKLYFSLLTPSTPPSQRALVEKNIVRLFLTNLQISQSKPDDLGVFALARNGSIAGVRLFLDAGYNANVRGAHNCTLLQRALSTDWELKLRNNARAISDSKIAMLKFLISRGADIHAVAGPKWTTLHLAVSNKLPLAVLAFIAQQAGVDLNAGDVDMETPLMWCAMLNLPEHAKFLVQHGADPSRRDNRGKTAFDYAKSDKMRQALQKMETP